MTRIQFSAPELDVLAASVAGEIQTQARQQSLPMLFLDVQPVDLTFSRGGYFAAMHDSGATYSAAVLGCYLTTSPTSWVERLRPC